MKHLRSYSHRARGFGFNDNTVEGFIAAANAGFEWLEMDLRRTKDGTIIAFHDPELDSIPIKDLTLDEIRNKLDQIGCRVPTLEEVLIATHGKAKFDFEFKESGFGWDALGVILKYVKREDFIYTSFDKDFLSNTKDMGQEIPLGIILGTNKGDRYSLWTTLSNNLFLARWRRHGFNMVVVHKNVMFNRFAKRAKKQGLEVLVWGTVNTEHYNKYIKRKNIDGVFCDEIPW